MANPELEWLEKTYRPHEPQLTVRAVLVGMLIGAVMCLSNLYVVLKTGWSIGVTVVSCIIAWALLSASRLIGARKMGVLENSAMGDVASGAGYMTGGGNMAALPALMMLTGTRPDAWVLVLWFAGIAALGVFAAIPIKRQLVNQEQLPFPTGTATAETIKVLHGSGPEGRKQGLLLGLAAAFGGTIAWWRDATKGLLFDARLPSTFSPSKPLYFGKPLGDWTIALEGSVLMLGVGALMSFRTGWSLLIGSTITFGILAPQLSEAGVIVGTGFKPIASWSVWMGAAVLASSGLTSFAFQWRSVARSVKELVALVRPKKSDAPADPLEGVEPPAKWFALGFLIFGPPVVVLGWYAFDIPLWAGAIALPLSVLMGIIAARVTGETDVTPTKALGPVTQLIYAALLPKALAPNIMSANITGGVGLHAADLLTGLKSGYLLGARPRQQLAGQLFGVLAGSMAVVPAFFLLVPTADVLGSKEFPAPSALVWANVSKMLVAGLDALHESARWAALIGCIVGIGLAVLEAKVPKNVKAFIPSPSGIGIAMVIPAYNSLMMAIGAGLAEIYRRRRGEKAASEVLVPTASGFIAGESIIGIVVKVLIALGVMAKG